ncbi:MAG: BamA/TamA family outer membrane protein, partial [Longimicrobiales bacterium]
MIHIVSRAARVIALAAFVAWTATLFDTGDVVAQNRAGFGPMRTVTPNPEYDAGGLHRLLFGDHNRELWTTSIRVAELDLGTFAGGLTPLQRGGGFQTRSLRFRGGDGREYAFRSVDKDPSSVLPPELRETLVRDLIQDQTSAGHPTAPLVVAPLLEAVGVLHPDPFLVIMPDDARLGEFRAEFANMLGFIEERPEDPTEEAPGFAGASNVVGTERLLERMQEDGERIDDRAFLTARLVDMFLGDWDRHRDQWRWARFGEGRDALWQPITRDRDQAFVRLDGLVLRLARRSNPQLVSFGAEYPSITGLTWNGRELDRRFLSGLEQPVWDSVAVFLQSRLTDDVIARAVRRLPPEQYAMQSATLNRRLIERRNKLREVAHRFYELLATEVDVHASDAAEVVTAERAEDQTLVVTIARRNGGPPRYQRRFLPTETDEVRLFLYGG